MIRLSDHWEINPQSDWESTFFMQSKQGYFRSLLGFLDSRWNDKNTLVLPEKRNIFKAFELTSLDAVKVVIMGQDPYPNKNHATGLSFGVPYGEPLPRSLVNIVNEVESCLNEPIYDEKTNQVIRGEPIMLDPSNMTLEGWAKQGVLMINSCLTTEEGAIAAHQGMGWEQFTDSVVYSVVMRRKPTVFMLWGEAAKEKFKKIYGAGHGVVNTEVLESTHPSPLSYNRGPFHLRFQGCRHFNLANQFLAKKNQTRIKWEITGA